MSFFAERKRRNLIRVAIACVLIARVSLQAIEVVPDVIGAPGRVIRALLGVAGSGQHPDRLGGPHTDCSMVCRYHFTKRQM